METDGRASGESRMAVASALGVGPMRLAIATTVSEATGPTSSKTNESAGSHEDGALDSEPRTGGGDVPDHLRLSDGKGCGPTGQRGKCAMCGESGIRILPPLVKAHPGAPEPPSVLEHRMMLDASPP